MIRQLVTRLSHKLFLAFGVAPKNLDLYRDAALGLLALVPIIFAIQPLFAAFSGDRVTPADIVTAAIWAAVALTLTLLSPNWNEVLGATWGVLALRGVIGFVLSRGDSRILAVTLLFFMLAIGCRRLKSPREIPPQNLHHSKRIR